MQLRKSAVSASTPHSFFLDITLPFSTLWTQFGKRVSKKKKQKQNKKKPKPKQFYVRRLSLALSLMSFSHISDCRSVPGCTSFPNYSLSYHQNKSCVPRYQELLQKKKKKPTSAPTEKWVAATLGGKFPSHVVLFLSFLVSQFCGLNLEQMNWASSSFAYLCNLEF